jgi:hypothetical protein
MKQTKTVHIQYRQNFKSILDPLLVDSMDAETKDIG